MPAYPGYQGKLAPNKKGPGNQGKMATKKKIIFDFNEARDDGDDGDDGVAVAPAGPYANHMHFAPDR